MPNPNRDDEVKPTKPQPKGTNASVGGTFNPSSLLNSIKSFTTNPFPTIGSWFQKAVTVQPTTRNPYYQVRHGDTFNSISRSTMTPLDKLVAANAGIKSAPPAGSYIKLDFADRHTTASPMTNINPSGDRVSIPASPALYRGGVVVPGMTGPASMGISNSSSAQYYMSPAQVMTEVQQINLADMMGMQVKEVSFQAAQANGVIPDQMIQAGYTQNFITGKWVLSGGGASTAPGRNVGGYNAMTGDRWGPGGTGNNSGGAIRNIHGTLMNGGGGGEKRPVAKKATNVGAGPSTVLGLRLGSG
jgi:hypothetical protein